MSDTHPTPDPEPTPTPDPEPTPTPDPEPDIPQWGKNLQEMVGGLVEKIDTLAGLNDQGDDESPSGKPWTHKKFW